MKQPDSVARSEEWMTAVDETFHADDVGPWVQKQQRSQVPCRNATSLIVPCTPQPPEPLFTKVHTMSVFSSASKRHTRRASAHRPAGIRASHLHRTDMPADC